MLLTLRPEAQAEALAQPFLAEMVASSAKWAWTLENDRGEFVASMAIMPDVGRRGWFVSYPGAGIQSAAELRALFRLYTIFRDSGAVYDELRAWVVCDDARAIRFAEWFGFRLDCGPATAFSPTGRDMSLYLWRRP
jgi:hypothetical protein